MTEAAIPIREVIRLLLEADSYPCIGNDDWRVADRMEAEALGKATSVPLPDDPPEFGLWLQILRRPGLQNSGREEVYAALHDYFDEAVESDVDRRLPRRRRLDQQPHRERWHKV